MTFPEGCREGLGGWIYKHNELGSVGEKENNLWMIVEKSLREKGIEIGFLRFKEVGGKYFYFEKTRYDQNITYGGLVDKEGNFLTDVAKFDCESKPGEVETRGENSMIIPMMIKGPDGVENRVISPVRISGDKVEVIG